jgi:hypothetical protein
MTRTRFPISVFPFLKVATISVMIMTVSACSTLVGNVKPVDQKSTDYGVLDLARENPAVWKKLSEAQLQPKDAQIGTNKTAFSSEITDLAWQSQKTFGIISLNTSCREGRPTANDLKPYLRELLLGISDITEREESTRQVSGQEALQAIIAGKMAGESTKIKALVLAKENCIYDLMYISRPERFNAHDADFNRFVSSLRLR